MSETNILKEIEKSKGYDIALFTTFNFEIPFFERFVENALLSCGVRTISLFVDSKELNKAIDDAGNTRGIGIRYVVNPIEMRASFHPKLMLLLGKGSAKLIVASANLTTSGFCVNNEIFNSFELSSNHCENKTLIISAIDFFSRLNELSFGADQDLFKEVIRYREAYSLFPEKPTHRWFIDNIDSSVLDSVNTIVEEPIKTIDVAVPFFDTNLNALQRVRKEYPSATIKLYLQNKQSRIQVDSLGSINDCKTVDYSGFRDRDHNFFYHGKVFRFRGENTFLLYGSANCTESALCKSYTSGGNIECCILEQDSEDASQEFFDNFIPCAQGEEIEYAPLKYTSDTTGIFFFRYGEYIDNQICLHLGHRSCSSVSSVKYANKELPFELTSNEMIVKIVVEDILPRNIQVSISYDNVEEVIRCWYVSPVELSLHRMSTERKDPLDSVDLASDDRYEEDRRIIVESLALNVGEFTETQYKLSQLRIDESVRAGEDDNDNYPEDGVIEYTIPPADYIREIKRYEKLSRILDHNFVLFCKLPSSGESALKNHDSSNEPDAQENTFQKVVQRKPTSSEKQFKQFVNRRIRGFIDLSFVEIVDYEHYIKCATVFLNIFEKYAVSEHVVGLFDDYATAMNRVQILWNLVFLIEDNAEYEEETFVLAIRIVLENRFFSEMSPTEKVGIEQKEREILTELTSRTQKREDANKRAWILALEVLKMNPKIANDYVNEIYGYMPIKYINQLIVEEFSGAIVSGDKEKNPKVVVKVNTMKNKSNVSSKSIRELIKYNRQYNRWDTITLRFELLPEYIDARYPDPMVAIEYCYHLRKDSVYTHYSSEKCYLTRYYKSGKKTDPESYTPPRDYDF